ncbi:hypothetical protein [Amycolatopsis sp. H20-H5]|uniref:hypothetical protein n=1 Tax=Amycolatopsis sp. H20-H5 TaxID=3046309 RepID=UPI002DB92880|nr:hypothetical protein [Amycolatopsis sp. H20-H5]MEC3981775.1 hypothetical protein [Amycolatopsis sp. H20-H5]
MRSKKLCQVAAISMALMFGGGVVATAASATPAPEISASAVPNGDTATDSPEAIQASRTADQAIAWYKSKTGSTAYEHYCEKAARLSWARTTHHVSAIEHWKSSDGVRHTTGVPPKGAFVFWGISQYGHVGIADGTGHVWATDVNNRIGYTTTHHFSSYLGWKAGNSN